jgi:zinc protease
MNVSLISFFRVPFQYFQTYSSKLQQTWQEKYGPFFKHLQETLAQKCCFRRSATPTAPGDTPVKTDELATKTLQPEKPATIDLDQILALDPKTTVKTLDNGFTYYVRHNEYPSKDTACLRLVVRAGSTDEQEHERGLAHFLEHMLFQGTENFERQEIKRLLESKGAAFGGDQNAHTTYNETVYKFTIPLNEPELLDKALFILREMATKAKISDSCVEEERAVILDEISRDSASGRYIDKRDALLFEGTPYPVRRPRGLAKVIRECTPDDIRAFYKRTYLPQNMALVAVGDFDQKQVEGLIQKYFGDMAPSKEAPIKHDFLPVKRQEPHYLCYDDPESTGSLLQLHYPLKMEFGNHELTKEHVLQGIINSLYQTMFNHRLQEIITDSDSPPFIFAQGKKEELVDNLFYYRLTLVANDSEIPNAYKRLLLELKRVREHGFLPEEFEAVKKTYKANLESLEIEKNNVSNLELAKSYISHFTDGTPYGDLASIVDVKKNLLEYVKIEHVNAWNKILTSPKGTVISTLVPHSLKDTVTPEILKKASEEAAIEPVSPPVHTVIERALLRQIPKPGNIVDTIVFEKTGVTKLILENGMNVYIRPSAKKEDTILIYNFSNGGELSAPYEKRAAAEMAAELYALSGQAGLTPSQMKKLLAGSSTEQEIIIGNYMTSLLTACTKKNLDTAFQLLYNAYADRTLRQDAFNTLKQAHLNVVKHLKNDPAYHFSSTESALCTQNHPHFLPISAEDYEKAEFQDAVDFLNGQFKNPGNFNLVITGNVDVEAIKLLVEKYLAGLPGERSAFDFSSSNYPSYQYPSGIVIKEIEEGIAGTCQTHISFPAPAKDTKESRILGGWTAQLLSMHLVDQLRFVKAENYGVDCDYSLTTLPGQEKSDPSSMELEITGLPENIRELNKIVLKEIEKLQNEGFSHEEVESYRAQLKETLRKSHDLDSFWMYRIAAEARWGRNIDSMMEDYDKILEQFDAKTAQDYLKRLFPLDRYVQVTLLPKQTNQN